MNYVAIALIALIVGFFLFGRAKPDVDGQAARSLVADEGATLVDVRSPSEFDGGHLPGAINIPVGELGQRLDELQSTKDEGRPIIVYCQSGMRSANAKKELERNGFERVHDLGGRHRW